MRKLALILAFLTGTPGLARGEDPEWLDSSIKVVDLDLREDETDNRSPFQVDLSVDLPVIVTGVVLTNAPALMDIHIHRNMQNLDPARLNRVDRVVLGNWDKEADSASDVLRTTTQFLPFVLNLVDVLGSGAGDGLSGYAKDTVILLEVIAVKNVLTTLSKYIIRRPRPYAYDSRLKDARRNELNASLSFYSGHTSYSFCMASAYSYLFARRHPDSPLVIPVWIGTHALASTTAVLRVKAGRHFWSDVVVGAAVGSAIGLVVPWLHTRGQDGIRMPDNLMVLPMVFEGGFGAVATLVY